MQTNPNLRDCLYRFVSSPSTDRLIAKLILSILDKHSFG